MFVGDLFNSNDTAISEDMKSELYAAAAAKIKKALANPKLDPATRKDYTPHEFEQPVKKRPTVQKATTRKKPATKKTVKKK